MRSSYLSVRFLGSAIASVVLVSACWLMAETFFTAKKNKNLSAADSKELSAQVLINAVQEHMVELDVQIAALLQAKAHAQRQTICLLEQLLENKSESFFGRSKKSALELYYKKLAQCEQQLARATQLVAQSAAIFTAYGACVQDPDAWVKVATPTPPSVQLPRA